MTFVVTTPAFSGPVQKLLELISGHDIDILDVEIAPLVDSFVAVVHNEQTNVSMDELSEFLLIAAILLEMKSGRLLPRPEMGEPDEEFVGWEERDVLLARLLELRTYGSLAHVFVSLFDRAHRSHPRLVGFNAEFYSHRTGSFAGCNPRHVGHGIPEGNRGETNSLGNSAPRNCRFSDGHRDRSFPRWAVANHGEGFLPCTHRSRDYPY